MIFLPKETYIVLAVVAGLLNFTLTTVVIKIDLLRGSLKFWVFKEIVFYSIILAAVYLSLREVTVLTSLDVEVGVPLGHLQINVNIDILLIIEIKFVVLDCCLLDVPDCWEFEVHDLIIILCLHIYPEVVGWVVVRTINSYKKLSLIHWPLVWEDIYLFY